MSGRHSAAVMWSATAALALAAAFLLTRNILMLTAQVPLDPNEGWNAAHALAAMAGHGLYPPPQSLMVNNYPPLSFYMVGAFGKLTGDVLVAGRILSICAFVCVAVGIAQALQTMGCSARARIFAAVFFCAVLLIASNYVGINDPQLLGHAVQIAALLLVLRQKPVAAAALFALSLFVKQNLLALPFAAGLWLVLQDRRAGLRFAATGLICVGAGLIACRLAGIDLIAQLASPRLWSLANMRGATGRFLSWAALPLLIAAKTPRDKYGKFCLLYGAAALLIGLGFSAGDGVDANIFFDAVIALSLALGLTLDHIRWRGCAALAAAAPLLVFLALNFADNNFFFAPDFARQSARDIVFLKARPGPALCAQISLCLWAGKDAGVDVFNVGEQIQTGARDPAPLEKMLLEHRFTALQFEDSDIPLVPRISAAIKTTYRIDHADDNGVFLVPR
jgi:hypothetical protein